MSRLIQKTMNNTEYSTSSQKAKLIDWAQRCQAVCREEGDAKAATMIEDAIDRHRDDRLVVSVMGLAKRGKSTLLNALLGRTDDILAPVDKLPATCVTTTYTWADTMNIEVIDREGKIVNISPEEVRDYATEEGNKENHRNVQVIRITGPFDERLKRVTLVDLPGLGSIHEHHDQIVHQFLPQSDAILLLSTARMPINQDEIDLLKNARLADIQKIFVAINMVDKADDDELADCEAHNQKQIKKLGINIPAMHKISALRAFQGQWDASGVGELWAEMDTFLQKERGAFIDKRLVSSVMQAASAVVDALSIRVSSQGKSAEEIATLQARLESEKRKINNERDIKEREFKLKWNLIIDQVINELPKAETQVREELRKKTDSYGLARVNALNKDLPKFFSETLEEILSPVFTSMEQEMRQLTEKMESSYSNQSIELSCVFTGNDEKSGMGGILVGGGMIGGGIGMATAASTMIAASVTTVPVAGLSAVTSGLSALGLTSLAPAVAGLWPTTTVVVAPSAWLLVMGPVGWTLAGVGSLAVPLSWSIAKKKQKSGIQDKVEKEITKVFQKLKTERLPGMRNLCNGILEEFRINLDRRLIAISDALDIASTQRADPHIAEQEKLRLEFIGNLLNGQATHYISAQ
jgi:predicted GTPase